MSDPNREFGLLLDPHAVLEVAPEATDDEIRAAYLRKVKQFPPDRNPVEFERVRDAYELLRDRRQRIRHRLLSDDLLAPLETLLERHAPPQRKFAGPEPWLAVLKEK
jgi:curved DNA-binding protein CbpA